MSALHDIQKKLKVGKNNTNDFCKYKYRNCSDILEAVKPLLPDGYYITLSDDVVIVDDRIYVKSIATLTNGDKSFTASAFAREPLIKKGMDDSQITGATSSYARKYALTGLFAIDDTDDADTADNRDYQHQKQAPVKKAPAKPAGKIVMDETMFGNYMEKWHSDISTKGRTSKSIIDKFALTFELSEEQIGSIVLLESTIKQQQAAGL